MATNVVMPQMGESIAEGTIVRWIKKVGDTVDRDEPLFEISTDKVDAEIPSPGAGVLTEIKVKEGETVPVNCVVAVIGAAGEAAGRAPSPVPQEPAQLPEAGSRAAGRQARLSAARRRGRAGRAAAEAAPAAGTADAEAEDSGGRSRRRWCGGSRASTTSTSGRSTAPASAAA